MYKNYLLFRYLFFCEYILSNVTPSLTPDDYVNTFVIVLFVKPCRAVFLLCLPEIFLENNADQK